MSTKTGIIYCRVSSAEQVDGTSLDTQERLCREFALREGIEVLHVFIEKGESAKTADRTEFQKAIAFCSIKKTKIDYFIVYKLDRFARNQNDHHIVASTLKRYGTILRSVTEPINESATGQLMEGILSSFAQFDNTIRTERSVGGMQERIKQGIWVFRAPFGYKRTGGKGSNLIVDTDAAPFIRAAFEEYAKGTYTYESLAEHLASRGFRTKTGLMPFPQLMEKILKNPLYCGIIRIWNEEYKGAFEPLISQDLFESCQEGYRKNSRNKGPRTAKNPHFSLRRLAVCDTCDIPLTASRSTGSHGKKYAYYHHQKQLCGKAKFIPKEDFEQSFVEYLNKITPNEEYEKIFKEIVLDIWSTNYKKLDEENSRTRKEVAKLEQDRQRVFELHRSGVYTDDDFLAQKAVVNRSIDQKHRLLNDKRIEEFNMEEALSYCFDFVRNTAKRWVKFEYPERVRFQKMIFDGNVKFTGEKFGTGELSLVYKGNQEYQRDKSTLVTPQRIEL